MPGKTTTAVEEIEGRVEMLDKQIEQALERASRAQAEARDENDNAARMAILRTQYKRVLEATLLPI